MSRNNPGKSARNADPMQKDNQPKKSGPVPQEDKQQQTGGARSTEEQAQFSPLELDIATLKKAFDGEPVAMPDVEAILDRNPEYWQKHGDLNRIVLDRVIKTNPLHKTCLRRSVEALRKDLAGKRCDPLERILIDRVVTCFLMVQLAQIWSQEASGDPKRWALQMKQLDQFHRHFNSAVMTLARTRRLMAGIKIQINHRGEASQHAKLKNAVASRMSEANLA